MSNFTVKSNIIKDGETMPNSTVHNAIGGENISPDVTWENAPENTKSFVVSIYDPDAPTISGWWHWGVYNIPADCNSIPEGKLPEGGAGNFSEIITDYGSTGYGGCYPPEGDKPHRYILTVYAMAVDNFELQPEQTTGAMLMFNMQGSILAEASVTGLFGR